MKNRTTVFACVSILLLSTYGFAAESGAPASSNIELTDEGTCAVNAADCEHPPKQKVTSKKRIAEVQDNQLRRIGWGVISNKLTAEEQEKLRASRATIQAAIDEAMKDGKMSKSERAEIRKLQIASSKEIFQLKSNQVDLDKRLEKMKKDLEKGIAKKDISPEEADLIQTRITNFETNLAKAKEGGLTPDEHTALVKESNEAIQATSYYGKGKKKQRRAVTNEMMGVLGMDLGMKIGKCAMDGKLTQEEQDKLYTKLDGVYALNEKYQTESVNQHGKLNKLDKSDKKDIQGELKALQFEIKEACGGDEKESKGKGSDDEKGKKEDDNKEKKSKSAS